MRYMMFVCVGEQTHIPADPASVPDIDDWVEETDRRGIRVDGERLVDPADARTVRVRDGEVFVTDGPFAETKEYIAGFDILECADLDAAIEIASQHPMARFGRLELRPFWDEAGGPTS